MSGRPQQSLAHAHARLACAAYSECTLDELAQTGFPQVETDDAHDQRRS